MDELTVVRKMEKEPPSLTGEARSAARVRLMAVIHQETNGAARSKPLSRRLLVRTAVLGTAAAAVAGTVVVVGQGDDTSRLPAVSAADVLHKAADYSRAEGTGLPIPRDDQYIYSKEISKLTPLGGGKAKTYNDETWLSVDGSKTSRYGEHGRVVDQPSRKHEVQWPPIEYSKLKDWPTDPDELYKWLTHDGNITIVGGKDSSGKEVPPPPNHEQALHRIAFSEACALMSGPRVAPPGLQAASFEAIAKLPGLKVDHDGVDALGRHGIAISYPHETTSFIFDRKTYAYLGLRQTGETGPRKVHGKDAPSVKYVEVRGRVATAVVDRLGERP